jgi:hypothetical protein
VSDFQKKHNFKVLFKCMPVIFSGFVAKSCFAGSVGEDRINVSDVTCGFLLAVSPVSSKWLAEEPHSKTAPRQ